jgi:hypothetical protein
MKMVWEGSTKSISKAGLWIGSASQDGRKPKPYKQNVLKPIED